MLKKLLNNPYFNALRNIRQLLDLDQKKDSVYMLVLLIFNAIFDVLGLSSLLPLIYAASDFSHIHNTPLLKRFYEYVGFETEIGFLLLISGFLVIIFVIKNVVSLFILHRQAKFALNIGLRLGQKQFQYYNKEGYLYINSENFGEKTYKMVSIPYYFGLNYIVPTLILTTEIAVILFIFTGMLLMEPLLVLLLVIVIVPSFILIYSSTKNKIKKLGDSRNKNFPLLYSSIMNFFSGFVDVRLGNKEAYFYNEYIGNQKIVNQVDATNFGFYQKIPQKTNEVIMALAIFVLFLFAYLNPQNSKQLIFLLGLFGAASIRVLPSLNRILSALITIKNHSYLIERLKPLKDLKLKHFEEIEPLPFKEKIQLENIKYQYPESNELVLQGISIEIKKGKTIGFLGESGSGKTTLINILLKILHETEGRIIIDDQVITSKNVLAYQKQFGYVQQQVFIKEGSIVENVAFGINPANIDYKKFWSSIKQAQLESFVKAHPEKELLQLGEHGVKLSGGQKQRVGIARALYKNSEILVFDEATSALDMDTEEAITETIMNLSKYNKTIVIIAHRITTLSSCDEIYELSKGKILKKYTYKELFKEKVLAN